MADTRYVRDYPAVTRHRSETRTAVRTRNRRLLLAVPAAAGLAWLAFSFSPPLGLVIAAMGVMAVFFVALPTGSSVEAGHLAGEAGEQAVLDALRALPDDFTIFNRVRLPDPRLPNGERELDFIVAGPTGLWVVEVKNTPGRVVVQPDRRHWPLVRRAGCGSRPAWNAMPNPIGQVRDQAEALQRWLLMNGVSAEPRPLICLAHPEVAVENAEASPVPVRVRRQVAEHLREAPAARTSTNLVETLAQLVAPGATRKSSAA